MANVRESSDADARIADLLNRYQTDIYRYARRRLPNHQATEELVAETFVVAWRRAERIPAGDDALYWLYAVASRLVANSHRRHRRSSELEARLSREREHDQSEPPFSQAEMDAMLAALHLLRPRDRELLQLVYWEKLSHREIALVLETSEKAVGIRVSRARHKLRALLVRAPTAKSLEGKVPTEATS